MEAIVTSSTPPPSVRWNSLERKKGGLHSSGQCGSSTTSLLQAVSSRGDSRPGSGRSPSCSSVHLQLLAVPQIHSPLEEASSEGTGSTTTLAAPAPTSSKFRRYSCNPPAKGGLTSSPQPHLRRSSLAAIKWSVLARRISMGMAHEREPPQDPTQVRRFFRKNKIREKRQGKYLIYQKSFRNEPTNKIWRGKCIYLEKIVSQA